MIHPPITAAEVPPEWIADVRTIALRDGHAVRAGAEATIEVQSINTGLFGRLMLPGSGHHFTSDAERDVVLAQLHGVLIEVGNGSGELTQPPISK